MSELININRSDDPNFRYKMIKPKYEFIGKGNGCKTIITNLDKVCKSLGVPFSILLKHIGAKTGSNITNQDYSITGHISNKILDDCIFDYINIFLKCAICDLPETFPKIIGKKKNKDIQFNCRACGEHYQIKNPSTCQTKTINNIIKYIEEAKNEWPTLENFSTMQSIDDESKESINSSVEEDSADKIEQREDDSDSDLDPFS